MICLIPKMSFYVAKLQKIDQSPIKCNSANTLSGCIEREVSRFIVALLTSNEAVDIFEQTITEDFSSVNTRLAFDTEIFTT